MEIGDRAAVKRYLDMADHDPAVSPLERWSHRDSLAQIRESSKGIPDSFGCDGWGDCSLIDCNCSNHLARAALTPPAPHEGEEKNE